MANNIAQHIAMGFLRFTGAITLLMLSFLAGTAAGIQGMKGQMDVCESHGILWGERTRAPQQPSQIIVSHDSPQMPRLTPGFPASGDVTWKVTMRRDAVTGRLAIAELSGRNDVIADIAAYRSRAEIPVARIPVHRGKQAEIGLMPGEYVVRIGRWTETDRFDPEDMNRYEKPLLVRVEDGRLTPIQVLEHWSGIGEPVNPYRTQQGIHLARKTSVRIRESQDESHTAIPEDEDI